MKLYNTLSRDIEEFKPQKSPEVSFYSCGPTVYDYTHIGHMRAYTNTDFLKRTLTYLGLKVNHVMNITDVGHLTGDTDEGEDKLEKGAKSSGKSVWDVAKFYTDNFSETMKALNILPAETTCKATDHIEDMVELVKKLIEKGFAYETKEAVYFDTSKFPNYGKLSGQKLEEKIQQARKEVVKDPEKKNPADFALWFKTVGRFAKHEMHWSSPWGEGFPGWHIECSAMSMKYLGETIDIHSGGVDHIPVHHENEIAQSEAATGKQFVKYWFHHEHLMVDGVKMSKSFQNFYTLEDINQKNIDPLALRYLFTQTHYRQQMNFTWESLQGAQNSFINMKELVFSLRKQTDRQMISEDKLAQVDSFRSQFRTALENDLQMPQAVAVVWSMLKSNIPSGDKLDLLYEFDKVLGLNLKEIREDVIPKNILDLVLQRETARKNKDFTTSDQLRTEIEKHGYKVEDIGETYSLKKLN